MSAIALKSKSLNPLLKCSLPILKNSHSSQLFLKNSYNYLLLNKSFSKRYASNKSYPPYTVINMPALSPTMSQGNLAVWNKSVGDKLQPGEPIAEVETDKAQMDFEFQEEGYLAKIFVDGGTKDVPVGKPIAIYVEDEADVSAFSDFTEADAGGSAPAPAPASEPAPSTSASASQPAESSAPAPVSEKPQSSPSPSPSSSSSSSSSLSPSRIFASPLAKTIALEKGIALKNITGTGPNGRITAKDVESYVPPPAPQQPSADTTPAPTTASSSAAAPSSSEDYEDIPITTMRSVIAKRLTESSQNNPSYIVSSDVSVSKLLKLRKSLNDNSNNQFKLSINDILIKAVAKTCQLVPQANSYWLENENVIRQFKNVDVSVAVATPTGLITPIVKNAHAIGLKEISSQVKDLGKRAKEGKLLPHEFQGGTITISNLGMNPAVKLFTSIINPPQSAIIAIATIEKKAIPDKANPNGFIFDDVINVTATFDHRVVDGALGGEWIKAFKKVVENPLELLL
ncbi:dihydrolipoyllysine-residue acetyltransferase [Ascoidea rubescens DSM 1968]|uniref:Acetyltransferase component of pyruvate dehydrogenase complex n=1 Tax=Ascoidea rubescens DSM 1968 TaxID=1344418 RepID=A0A1D2VBR8_9ASCO|nr:pyruvate dehydrogenase [Ascoidea rubescens DSM 1968]ODV59076.1 pyruvate dehydrogenase [Ascoidea rubescens DSM 1968]